MKLPLVDTFALDQLQVRLPAAVAVTNNDGRFEPLRASAQLSTAGGFERGSNGLRHLQSSD
jgi:hypothetical protein